MTFRAVATLSTVCATQRRATTTNPKMFAISATALGISQEFVICANLEPKVCHAMGHALTGQPATQQRNAFVTTATAQRLALFFALLVSTDCFAVGMVLARLATDFLGFVHVMSHCTDQLAKRFAHQSVAEKRLA